MASISSERSPIGFSRRRWTTGPPAALDEPREILLRVGALPEQHGNDANRGNAFGDERGDGLIERYAVLEERKADRSRGQPAREACRNALERPRPLRVARPVGDQNDAFLQ